VRQNEWLLFAAVAMGSACGDDDGGGADAAVDMIDAGGGAVDSGGADASPEATSLLNGQVAVWSLDGDGADGSGQALDLTITGLSFVSGKFGQGLSFDGDAAKTAMRPIDDPELRLASGDFTISVWASLRGAPQVDSMFVVEKGGLGGAWIGYNMPLFRGGYGLDSFVGGGDVATPDAFYHLVLVREGNTIRYYVDGVLGSMATVTDIAAPSTSPLRLGTPAQAPLDGVVDDLGIWNRALTAAERAYLDAHPIPTP